MPKKVFRSRNSTVTVDLPIYDKLKPSQLVDTKTAKELGNAVKQETLALTAVGKSPVQGVDRYEPYAAQRKQSGYPETPDIKRKYPAKKTRPVNLRLDGTFLDQLGFKKIDGGVEFGWLDPDAYIQNLIDTHNNGKHPHVPQRKVIPNNRGENYTASIRKLIQDVYTKRIRRIIESES